MKRPYLHLVGLILVVVSLARQFDLTGLVLAAPQLFPGALCGQVGEMVTVDGPVSTMGRLDCKEPSLAALESLARSADRFMTVTEDEPERVRFEIDL